MFQRLTAAAVAALAGAGAAQAEVITYQYHGAEMFLQPQERHSAENGLPSSIMGDSFQFTLDTSMVPVGLRLDDASISLGYYTYVDLTYSDGSSANCNLLETGCVESPFNVVGYPNFGDSTGFGFSFGEDYTITSFGFSGGTWGFHDSCCGSSRWEFGYEGNLNFSAYYSSGDVWIGGPGTWTVDREPSPTIAPVPLPATALLMAGGLGALGLFGRRPRRTAAA